MKLDALMPSTQPDGPMRAVFDTGAVLKVPPFVAADFCLYPGRELTEEEFSDLRAAISRARTRTRAVRIISATAISRGALEQRLTERGADADDARDTVAWLEDLHLIDDAATAEQLVQSAVRKGYGRRRIESILYEKKIPREYWQQALEAIPAMDDAIDRFLAQKLSGRELDDKTIKKAADALLRRGHSWSDVRAALARYRAALALELPEMEDME